MVPCDRRSAMRWIAVAVLTAASLGLLAGAVPAQDVTTQGTDMEQQMKRRRFMVQPKPDPQAVTQDVDRATEALRAEGRFDQTVRESRSPLSRRPNLDYDVTSGIQSRNVQSGLKALQPR